MKKLLITGASGFLGGHIFAQAESQFQCLGTFNTFARPLHVPDWLQLDLTDFSDVSELVSSFKPDIIIHSAANSNLDECEKYPVMARAANVTATAHLVSAAQRVRARFIYISTDMVFDGAGSLYKEDDPPHPLSVYGQTKLEAEAVVKQLEKFVIVRSALMYGRPKIGGSSFSMWIENRLCQQQNVPLYIDQFRSPILVNNLAELALELCTSDFNGLLHAGGANRIDRFTFGQQMCAIMGYDVSLLQPTLMNDHTSPAPRPRDVSLNIARAISILHTKILSTEEGLKKMRNA